MCMEPPSLSKEQGARAEVSKLSQILAIAALGATLASCPAWAGYLPPVDPPRMTPSGDSLGYEETYLFEVYNAVYGSQYTSSAELALDRRVDWETYAADGGAASLSFWAVWRNSCMDQEFGYYTSGGGYQELFCVGGMRADDSSSLNPFVGDADGDGIADITAELLDPASLSPIGFYATSTWDGQAAAWGSFHSEASRNYYKGGDDVALIGTLSEDPSVFYETHFLILSTPSPDTFLLAYEDLPYGHVAGHLDYNDLLVEMKIHPAVPEPATLTVLGLALAGLGIRGRFRRRLR